jgi:transposase
LLSELGHELLVGDATQIRASNPRRQKTDKRDAEHILGLLVEDRFPAIWQPPAENEQLRQLLLHRSRLPPQRRRPVAGNPGLVRLRTRVTNQLEGMAKNEGLLVPGGWSGKRRKAIEALPLPGWYGERRKDLLGLLDRLEERIAPLDKAVSQAAASNAEACLLMTHPGVGPVVSLAYVLTIGNWQRFARGKQVGSYLGLIPSEDSSSDKRRLGHISKQGNTLLRWLLVEAASTAQRYDPSWHRQYVRLSMTKHHGVAKVAIAHKLAVRLYWMLRSGEDYQHVRERGSTARQSECPGGRNTRPIE